MQHPSYYNTVIELFDKGMLRADIAATLGIKPAALSWQMKKFGFSFKRESYRLTTLQVDQLVERYTNGESVPSICKELPCSEDTALYLLRARGVVIRNMEQVKFYKGYTINELAFSDVNEEACAYFYGWLLTDGCLSKKSVSIELASRDEELLIGLQSYLQSSNTIRKRSRLDKRTGNTYHQSSFAFSHTPIVDRLKAFGLESRKSLMERCPEVFINNRHFWRGVIEGDGCISKTSNKLEVCGGKELVEAFTSYCSRVCLDYTPKIKMGGKMHVGYVCTKSQVKVVLDEIYTNCNYKLSRKYQIYLEKYCGN